MAETDQSNLSQSTQPTQKPKRVEKKRHRPSTDRMGLPTPTLPSWARDALTGAPLSPQVPLYFVVTEGRYDEKPDLYASEGHGTQTTRSFTPVPRTITTHLSQRPSTAPQSAQEHRDRQLNNLGGLEWSPGFTKYIGDLVPGSVAEARRQWREWWTVPYVVARLRCFERAKQLPPGAVDVAIAYAKGEDEAQIARRVTHSPFWVRTQHSRVVLLVRRLYLRYGDKYQPLTAAQQVQQELDDLERAGVMVREAAVTITTTTTGTEGEP